VGVIWEDHHFPPVRVLRRHPVAGRPLSRTLRSTSGVSGPAAARGSGWGSAVRL